MGTDCIVWPLQYQYVPALILADDKLHWPLWNNHGVQCAFWSWLSQIRDYNKFKSTYCINMITQVSLIVYDYENRWEILNASILVMDILWCLIQRTPTKLTFNKMQKHLFIEIQHLLKNFNCLVLLAAMHIVYLYQVQQRWTSFMSPMSGDSYTETNIVILTKYFITGCTRSCQNGNFWCSKWWTFDQNGDISISLCYLSAHITGSYWTTMY